jgi:NAD(P)H-dependent FMN reductase
MTHSSPTLVIGGSVRPRRLCVHIADWVAAVGRDATGGAFEVIDLRQWPLPMDDEPGIPAAGEYAQAHTQAWSRKVAGAGAFVFVTPQYNWGYPAALKNAIDHLHAEWRGKPAIIVTYGGRGGDKCAAQLRQVLDGLHMTTVPTAPALVLPRPLIEANTGDIDPAAELCGHLPELLQAFGELKAGRAETRAGVD